MKIRTLHGFWACCMDIGRFEQIRCFGTFNDGMSVDHAELGADILFDPDRKDKVCVTSAQGTVYAIKKAYV